MRSTFKVLFYLKKNNLNKHGEAPIMARITIDGAIAQFSCKAFILPDLWETKFNRAVGRSEKAVEINRLLDEIKSGVDKHYKKLLDRDSCVTAEKVKNAFLGLDMRSQTLLSLFKQHNEEYEALKNAKLIAKSTTQKYINTYAHFEAFLNSQLNRKDIALIELTPALINRFELYLATVPKLAHNSIFLYIYSLKKVITSAVKNRLLQYNPFDNYKISAKETDVGYLDKDEIKAIMNVKLSKGLDVIRDLFLFCSFTGLSFCDMRNLTRENKQMFFDDNEWVITRRQKTKTSSNVLLMDIPLKIIEKYEGLTESNKLLPVPSYTTLHKRIKEIARAAGINRNITWHMSRHTYATEICLTNGMPIESLKKTMGHKRISTTERYARVINEKVSKDMEKLSNVVQSIEQFKCT